MLVLDKVRQSIKITIFGGLKRISMVGFWKAVPLDEKIQLKNGRENGKVYHLIGKKIVKW